MRVDIYVGEESNNYNYLLFTHSNDVEKFWHVQEPTLWDAVGEESFYKAFCILGSGRILDGAPCGCYWKIYMTLWGKLKLLITEKEESHLN